MGKTPRDKDHLLIGAHTSTAGGLHHALLQGQEIGATTIQIFTSNQKQWKGRKITDEILSLWKETKEKTGLKKIMSHDSYLINLGSPNKEILDKSLEAFSSEIKRCQALEIDFLNFHPGAATTSTAEKCLKQIVKSLKTFENLCAKGSPRLLLETTAGQGSSIGHCFEQLSYILQETKNFLPMGICIDTCHIFAAGYDIREKKDWENTLKEFDKIIGLKHLYAFHLNDSKTSLHSRTDRHEHLGKGKIGLQAFRFVMKHPKLRKIPKYLETPKNLAVWKKEIALLRKFAQVT